MKRHLLPAVAFALLPTVVSAQVRRDPVDATAPVKVTVLSEVELTRTGTTDFGPVGSLGGTYTIDPRAPTGAQQTARFTAIGAPGATIVVSWASTLDLCNETAGCGTKLVFTPSLSNHGFSNSSGYQAISSVITSGSNLALNGIGEHYVWLGGSVTVSASQASGVYSGTFTLVATYL